MCLIGCVCTCVCVYVCVCVCHPRKLIVDNFIPVAEVEKIKGRAVLNPETGEWTLTPVQASDRLSQYVNTITVCVYYSVCVTLLPVMSAVQTLMFPDQCQEQAVSDPCQPLPG